MEKITFIIPIHKFNEEVSKYLANALKSIKAMSGINDSKVMFVGPSDVISSAENVYNRLKIKQPLVTVPNDETDINTQINKGVMSCTTPYFSVLEYDDVYTKTWAKNFDIAKNENKTISAFLPLTEIYQVNETESCAFANEIVWSNSFSDEESGLGFVTINTLDAFAGFSAYGAIISTESFISVGGLKTSMKIAAWYEFLMRFVYNNKSVYVVPRIGYKHEIGREDSYTSINQENISEEEVTWLISTAKEEYFFNEDRKKVYEKKDN